MFGSPEAALLTGTVAGLASFILYVGWLWYSEEREWRKSQPPGRALRLWRWMKEGAKWW